MHEHREQPFRPLLLLLFLFAGLLVFSWVPAGFVRSAGLKPLKLFADLKPDALYASRKSVSHPNVSSAGAAADSALPTSDLFAADTVFYSFYPFRHALSDFFMAFKSKKKVRIAYFGDSMIEGDLITQTIRELYQKKYGGSGVGLVPLTSPVAGFRQSIVHTFSDNWRENNILSARTAGQPPGITGHVFLTPGGTDTGIASSALATYMPGRGYGNGVFHQAKVLLKTTSVHQWVSVKLPKQAPRQLKPGAQGQLQLLSFNVAEEKGPVQFRFGGGGEFPVYGISFEGDSGLYVDNLAFRGNSGMPMTRIPSDLLSATDSLLDYDLVILQYGINAVSATVTDYSWYTRALLRTLMHFRKAMPGTSVLLIGTADKGYNSEEGYITDPGVPRVTEAQKKAAKQAQAAFMDLFSLMGGEGTMVKWADARLPLANKDYTHVNFRGAACIGKLIFDCLENEKDQFLKQNDNRACIK